MMPDSHEREDQGGSSIAPRASLLVLPPLEHPPATLLDYLRHRFSHVDAGEWERRIAEGKILLADGTPATPDTPYRAGLAVRYYREVRRERAIPFHEEIIFRNDEILIADKPHFLPVTPSGEYVNECLLFRLKRSTGIEELSPVHRLDLETAGMVLFSLRKETRHLYHRLFADGTITREYLAMARLEREPEGNRWLVRNRLVAGEPWFRMRIAEGEPNAVTEIVLLERKGDRALFRLTPRTGKKHQLRIHLASLGFPIIDDQLYPVPLPPGPYDHTRPLRLLAERLRFRDPVTGEEMEFMSGRELE